MQKSEVVLLGRPSVEMSRLLRQTETTASHHIARTEEPTQTLHRYDLSGVSHILFYSQIV